MACSPSPPSARGVQHKKISKSRECLQKFLLAKNFVDTLDFEIALTVNRKASEGDKGVKGFPLASWVEAP